METKVSVEAKNDISNKKILLKIGLQTDISLTVTI